MSRCWLDSVWQVLDHEKTNKKCKKVSTLDESLETLAFQPYSICPLFGECVARRVWHPHSHTSVSSMYLCDFSSSTWTKRKTPRGNQSMKWSCKNTVNMYISHVPTHRAFCQLPLRHLNSASTITCQSHSKWNSWYNKQTLQGQLRPLTTMRPLVLFKTSRGHLNIFRHQERSEESQDDVGMLLM